MTLSKLLANQDLRDCFDVNTMKGFRSSSNVLKELIEERFWKLWLSVLTDNLLEGNDIQDTKDKVKILCSKKTFDIEKVRVRASLTMTHEPFYTLCRAIDVPLHVMEKGVMFFPWSVVLKPTLFEKLVKGFIDKLESRTFRLTVMMNYNDGPFIKFVDSSCLCDTWFFDDAIDTKIEEIKLAYGQPCYTSCELNKIKTISDFDFFGCTRKSDLGIIYEVDYQEEFGWDHFFGVQHMQHITKEHVLNPREADIPDDPEEEQPWLQEPSYQEKLREITRIYNGLTHLEPKLVDVTLYTQMVSLIIRINEGNDSIFTPKMSFILLMLENFFLQI